MIKIISNSAMAENVREVAADYRNGTVLIFKYPLLDPVAYGVECLVCNRSFTRSSLKEGRRKAREHLRLKHR